jgi:Holliday junction resolvase RusA-like endonuclease
LKGVFDSMSSAGVFDDDSQDFELQDLLESHDWWND